jgi:hypothetical protein
VETSVSRPFDLLCHTTLTRKLGYRLKSSLLHDLLTACGSAPCGSRPYGLSAVPSGPDHLDHPEAFQCGCGDLTVATPSVFETFKLLSFASQTSRKSIILRLDPCGSTLSGSVACDSVLSGLPLCGSNALSICHQLSFAFGLWLV